MPDQPPATPPPRYKPPTTAEELLARYAAGERYFAGAQLRGANLSGARLWQADFSRADLAGADLSRAMIEDACFSDADLTRTDLSGARCHGACFDNAVISQARLPGSRYLTDEDIAREASSTYRGRNEHVFVSYSRKDESLVSSIVALVRSLGSRAFMDVSSIAPGEKWRPAIAKAVDDAAMVLVFWCTHSAGSPEVHGEYRRAHSQRKAIIPLLLDATPVLPPLSDYQWLDFTGTFASHDPSRTQERFAEDQRRHAETGGHIPLAPGLDDAPGEQSIRYCMEDPPSLREYESRDIANASVTLLQTLVREVESRTAERRRG